MKPVFVSSSSSAMAASLVGVGVGADINEVLLPRFMSAMAMVHVHDVFMFLC